MCEKIRETDTKLERVEWETVEHGGRYRTHDDVYGIELGQALRGNSNLETLVLEFRHAYQFDTLTEQGSEALAIGMQNCQLKNISIMFECYKKQKPLFAAIQHLPKLEYLHMQSTSIDFHALRTLLEWRDSMVSCPPLTLDISGHDVTPEDMSLLFTEVHNYQCIHGFHFSGNQVSNTTIAFFVRNWRHDSQLKHLRLRCSDNLTPVVAQMLMRAVAQHPALEHLDLYGNRCIGYEGLQYIGEELGNVRLVELNIRGCFPLDDPTNLDLGGMDSASQALSRGLSRNNTLQHLDCDLKRFGPDGIARILRATAGRPVVLSLNTVLSFDSIAELRAVGEALPIAKLGHFICRVEIEREDSDEDELVDAFRSLAQALQENRWLQQFDFFNSTFLGIEALPLLMQAVSRHPTIKKAVLYGGQIGPDGLRTIGQLLATSTLTSLHLDYQPFIEGSFEVFDGAFLALADGVRLNRSIKTLSLSHQGMRFTNAQELMLAVTNHPTMQELTIGKSITTSYDEIKFIAEHVLPDLRLKKLYSSFYVKETAAVSSKANATREILLQAIKSNYYLHYLRITDVRSKKHNGSYFDMRQWKKEIKFHLDLNRCGRSQLMGGNSDHHLGLSPSLFCQFLSNVSSKPSYMYYFLCEHPDFISSSIINW